MNQQYSSYFLRISRLFQLIFWVIQLAWFCRSKYSKLSTEKQEQYTRKKANKILNILNINIKTQGIKPENMSKTLVVANHISWLDMIAVMSLYPVNFVAKTEIQKWPILGRVVHNVGSIFIDRAKRKDVNYINQSIADGLKEGKNIMFFPEAGTSDDGFCLKPFKAALFQAAILAGSPIQALTIRYYEQEKRTNRSAYTKGMSLLQCVWNIVSLPHHEIHLDFIPLLSYAQIQNMTHHQIKEQIENEVRLIMNSDLETTEVNP